ncbi:MULTISPECIES: hypothetical protein [unclassified Mesorhizobium]|uniref:hypothetical protein n=1 Tax=unclassified Mesorhizobium TaxID=325217 RepID=UPI001FED6B6D|nr:MULTISPECIES: hypothetical protein [unclassified Mesorhizobium]
MRLIRFVLALIVLGLGALWSLQGLGLVKGSFMTGQRNGSISASSPCWSAWSGCAGRTARASDLAGRAETAGDKG